jgi:quinol monooxygenase YgiN
LNGKVIARSYIARGRKADETTVVVLEQWEEDINALNTHATRTDVRMIVLEELILNRSVNMFLEKCKSQA